MYKVLVMSVFKLLGAVLDFPCSERTPHVPTPITEAATLNSPISNVAKM